jgi:hypothetical protein
LDDPVQKPALAWLGMVLNWFRFIEQRDAHDLRMRQQAQKSHRPVAKIEPIADI